ncbi:serine hydrolase domain-containing protein [Actinomadura sp. 9N407]|uniref:serine hydrolase domain-containing protein n=1 Tax=Actinomadura sp. 9N407 TaxID=3375154 RepID=UPI0037A4A079
MGGKSGFSKAGLERVHGIMAGHVAAGRLPGLVTLVSRGGEVHTDVIGTSESGGALPMRRDSIFRISSMTKPITAVAALILVEECRLRLDEPVERLLPELADRRVLRSPDARLDDTVPANRPITVRDALDFRLGLGMILEEEAFGHPFFQAAQELGISGFGPPRPGFPHAPDEWLRLVATLPLVDQPGERWTYNIGSYIQGILVERATGRPFPEFVRERILEPLGMRDTGFHVPAADLDRFTASYGVGEDGALEPYDPREGSAWSAMPAFPDGAGSMVSTADDYLAFARMLLGKGTYRGERILSRRSVELMTSNRLTPEQTRESFGGASGWGFGVAAGVRQEDLWGTPGRYGWDGGLGTSWYTDPAEDLIGILLTQRLQFPTDNPVWLDFWTSLYAALDG